MSRKRRRHRERTVVFPWETRAPAFSWFSRRHAGAGVGVLIALVAVWAWWCPLEGLVRWIASRVTAK